MQNHGCRYLLDEEELIENKRERKTTLRCELRTANRVLEKGVASEVLWHCETSYLTDQNSQLLRELPGIIG
jgi:DNA-binding HxlR family transcriptional regulator